MMDDDWDYGDYDLIIKRAQRDLATLRAENAKLREALQEILKWFGDYPSFIPSYENVIQDRVESAIKLARAALA